MGNAKIQLEQYGCQGLTPNQMIIHASDIMLRTNSQNNEGPLLVLYHQNQGNTCYKAHLIVRNNQGLVEVIFTTQWKIKIEAPAKQYKFLF